MAKIDSILVVGGGVAGLTTAAALHRHDLPVELVERRDTWWAPGAGFLVHANGVRMLSSLGLGSGVEEAGAVIRRWHFCDQQGDLLSETDLEALWDDTGPCVGIERPELQRALLPGVVDLRCRLGTSVTTLVQDDARVRVGFSDGSTGHYDLVVGADGMKSTVRDLILGTRPPSELGAMAWRSISKISSIPGPTAIQFHLGDGCPVRLHADRAGTHLRFQLRHHTALPRSVGGASRTASPPVAEFRSARARVSRCARA